MTFFEDNPLPAPDSDPRHSDNGVTESERVEQLESSETQLPLQAQEAPPDASLIHQQVLLAPAGGDPISYTAIEPPPSLLDNTPNIPADLRIYWSWPHLVVTVLFFFISQFAVGIAILTYYSANIHMSESQIKKFLEAPKFQVGTTVAWSAVMLLFLYVTVAVLRNLPFWSSLGWRKFGVSGTGKGHPWMYLASGAGLSIFVAIASSRVKNTDHIPIQELFKNRSGALLLVAMAVIIAPFFEETVFRGYLYPTLARLISALAQSVGLESPGALRIGVGSSIFVTGLLFGLLHAPQLGWTWGLVTLLITVGVIFTFVRAWTGTVLASFLLHLGYNSTIAITSLIATRGFTHMPGP